MLRLSFQIAKAEFKLRNEGNYLGLLWYLLGPIVTFITLFSIFSTRLGNGITNYGPYLMIGLLMFNFFQSTTSESAMGILAGGGLLKSINFPRESLIISVIFKNIFSHINDLVIMLIMLIYLHISLLGVLFVIPFYLLFIIFISGTSLVLASLQVYINDLNSIWGFATRILWLATPIFYAIEGQVRLAFFNLFNPIYYFITLARQIIIYHTLPEMFIMWGAIGWSFGTLAIGYFVFEKLKPRFAELI